MEPSMRSCTGRADPFGLLVLAVLFALTVTVGIQIQVSATAGGGFTSPMTLLSGFSSAAADSNG